jgi:N-formylglutamate deformylase
VSSNAPLRYAGSAPLVISLPHSGTLLPDELRTRLTPAALRLEDTDWHVERLYRFARETGAAWLEAQNSRYLIDLNRPPDDASLYPGQLSTGLCPAATFAGEPLYRDAPPTAAEVAARRQRYWEPYHAALRELLDAARARHGFAVLLDAHSIRSEVPRLFAGRLPDVNLGTADGRACDPRLATALVARLAGQSSFSHVLNGRFKGGHITRAYGRPEQGVHAVQFELAQAAYMDEQSLRFEEARAAPLGALLRLLVAELLAFRPAPGAGP